MINEQKFENYIEINKNIDINNNIIKESNYTNKDNWIINEKMT